MTEKEKAEKLVKTYSKYVNGYVGSSMLSNTEYPETILNNAKQCALIAVDEIIKDYNDVRTEEVVSEVKLELILDGFIIDQMQYWEEVRHQIELL